MEKKMTLLLFNVMGLDFAIDVAPVRAMLPVPPPGEKSRHVVYLHEKIALPQVPVVYRSPRALAMDTGTRRFHLVIDAPRDMPVTVPVKSLRPFPPLVQPFIRNTPVWAVWPMEKRLVLVIDPLKFF